MSRDRVYCRVPSPSSVVERDGGDGWVRRSEVKLLTAKQKSRSFHMARPFLSLPFSVLVSSKAKENKALFILLSAFYLDDVYLVTALVPSETACLASSPGRIRRTAVWISREEIVERLL